MKKIAIWVLTLWLMLACGIALKKQATEDIPRIIQYSFDPNLLGLVFAEALPALLVFIGCLFVIKKYLLKKTN